jgi:four helix bundle protein
MFSYEKLDVYKKAYSVNQAVYRFIKKNNSIPLYAKNQLGRASLSIMLNIAEGNSKFSNKDKRNFFVVARGSASECAALVHFLTEEDEINGPLKKTLYSAFEEISIMLYKMIKNLETKN